MSEQDGKTLFLFPGLDAVLDAEKIRRWLDVPFIRQTLESASQSLSEATGKNQSLVDLFANMRRPQDVDEDLIHIGLIAIQYAIALESEKRVVPDILTGCSHGDLGRMAFAGCLPLWDTIHMAWASAQLRTQCVPGVNASARSVSGRLTGEQLNWLRRQDVVVSQWTHHHATVAGSLETISNLRERAFKRGLKMHVLLRVPVHSPLMRPVVDEALRISQQFVLQPPRYPIFSSVYVRRIKNADELRQEAVDASLSEIRWMETLSRLIEEEDVRRIICIGPSSTLANWIMNDDNIKGIEVVDAWDLCGEQAGTRLPYPKTTSAA